MLSAGLISIDRYNSNRLYRRFMKLDDALDINLLAIKRHYAAIRFHMFKNIYV